MHKFLKGFKKPKVPPRTHEGQGLAEYALILTLVAMVAIFALAIVGPAVGNVFSNIVTSIDRTSSGDGGGGGGGSVDVVEIIEASYNPSTDRLHLDATSNGGADPGTTLTATPGGVMVMGTNPFPHYHLLVTIELTGCPCQITVTSSLGGVASVMVP
jgi:pilus assembly protein Flp/PilA